MSRQQLQQLQDLEAELADAEHAFAKQHSKFKEAKKRFEQVVKETDGKHAEWQMVSEKHDMLLHLIRGLTRKTESIETYEMEMAEQETEAATVWARWEAAAHEEYERHCQDQCWQLMEAEQAEQESREKAGVAKRQWQEKAKNQKDQKDDGNTIIILKRRRKDQKDDGDGNNPQDAIASGPGRIDKPTAKRMPAHLKQALQAPAALVQAPEAPAAASSSSAVGPSSSPIQVPGWLNSRWSKS